MGLESSPLECAAGDGQQPQHTQQSSSKPKASQQTPAYSSSSSSPPPGTGLKGSCPFVSRLEADRPAPAGTLASSPPPACPQIPVAFSAPPGPPDS